MPEMMQQQVSVLPDDAVLLPELTATPSQVAKCWPANEPLIALIASDAESKWARWSIIAPANGKRLTLQDSNAMDQLQNMLEEDSNTTLLPNWIGYLGYELGYSIENGIASIQKTEWPLIDLIWCEQSLVHDAETNCWWSIGGLTPPTIHADDVGDLSCDMLEDPLGEEAFLEAVERTVEYIHAGDIFQANVTRRFQSEVQGNIRQRALSMLGEPGGWFGAWIEFPTDGRYLLSMSPELFLQVDGQTREVITRPMKGTCPENENPLMLLNSSKDAAELHMIVDLMRNDLGRVCQFGTMEVRESRSVERHPTVWQCVGEVRGVLREEVSICDVLEATFPGGSVTGAPKIRAMQIIHELEHSPRGPYCGAIGVLGKSSLLNVAIRTAMFVGTNDPSTFQGTMNYGTGCGIVAESNPQSELEESKVKTHILRTFFNQ